ncbi:MAG: DUF2461 domain-containing protein [Muribaculaceae bacterium]|nr:DUF2461 domain-containing protein [Muribaculaceae bacterium]
MAALTIQICTLIAENPARLLHFKLDFFVPLPKISPMEEILTFLDDILHNNNRLWFQEHKKQYQTAQANFNALAEQIIAGVQKFDDNCKDLTLKDCTYRFYRDTRFSPDKRPYKTHFGVFVCPEGKNQGDSEPQKLEIAKSPFKTVISIYIPCSVKA